MDKKFFFHAGEDKRAGIVCQGKKTAEKKITNAGLGGDNRRNGCLILTKIHTFVY